MLVWRIEEYNKRRWNIIGDEKPMTHEILTKNIIHVRMKYNADKTLAKTMINNPR
jgi:hypothetical protein